MFCKMHILGLPNVNGNNKQCFNLNPACIYAQRKFNAAENVE